MGNNRIRYHCIVLAMLLGQGQIVMSAVVGYGPNNGPNTWGGFCNSGGRRQSPINIVTSEVTRARVPALVLSSGYSANMASARLENVGYGADVTATWNGPTPEVSGGNLPSGSYVFQNIHFHWGENDRVGSEHTINGQPRPLEMHLVHRNKKYATTPQALQNEDGLVVISILFNIQGSDNWDFSPIINALGNVRSAGSSAPIQGQPISLNLLMPQYKSNFFTYKGSLTTPDCNEVVTWFVMQQSVRISWKQLAEFRKLQGPDGLITRNYRPTQPLNGRIVQYSTTNGVLGALLDFVPPRIIGRVLNLLS